MDVLIQSEPKTRLDARTVGVGLRCYIAITMAMPKRLVVMN